MNGQNEGTMNVRLIDMTTGEEIGAFDSIPVEVIQSTDFSSQKDYSALSVDLVGAKFSGGISGLLTSGMLVDLKGFGVYLRKGQKIPKRKRLRKKWAKKYGEEFDLKNVLLKGWDEG